MSFSKIYLGAVAAVALSLSLTGPVYASKRTHEKLHSAPEVFAATTADTTRVDSENLSMDDLSEDSAPQAVQTPPKKTPLTVSSDDSELDAVAESQPEPKGAKGKGSVNERESIRADLESIPAEPKLESRISNLEKELQSLKNSPSSAVVQNSSVSEIKTSSSADLVPEHKRESILKRLKIVETLIRKHGLAYDYRGMTTHQLEETLASLNDPR